MDLFPAEIWYQILSDVAFENRIVYSSWLEIIESQSRFSELMVDIERIRKLPNTIPELVVLSSRLKQDVKDELRKDFDVSVRLCRYRLSIHYQNEYLTFIYGDDDQIEYCSGNLREQFSAYEDFLKESLRKKTDICIKLDALMKERYFPHATSLKIDPHKIYINFNNSWVNIKFRIRAGMHMDPIDKKKVYDMLESLNWL